MTETDMASASRVGIQSCPPRDGGYSWSHLCPLSSRRGGEGDCPHRQLLLCLELHAPQTSLQIERLGHLTMILFGNKLVRDVISQAEAIQVGTNPAWLVLLQEEKFRYKGALVGRMSHEDTG